MYDKDSAITFFYNAKKKMRNDETQEKKILKGINLYQ